MLILDVENSVAKKNPRMTEYTHTLIDTTPGGNHSFDLANLLRRLFNPTTLEDFIELNKIDKPTSFLGQFPGLSKLPEATAKRLLKLSDSVFVMGGRR